jgi:hypothetical protein
MTCALFRNKAQMFGVAENRDPPRATTIQQLSDRVLLRKKSYQKNPCTAQVWVTVGD